MAPVFSVCQCVLNSVRHDRRASTPQRRHQRIATIRRAAVNHHQTVGRREREDVGAAAGDEHESIGQSEKTGLLRSDTTGRTSRRAGRRQRRSGAVCGRSSRAAGSMRHFLPAGAIDTEGICGVSGSGSSSADHRSAGGRREPVAALSDGRRAQKGRRRSGPDRARSAAADGKPDFSAIWHASQPNRCIPAVTGSPRVPKLAGHRWRATSVRSPGRPALSAVGGRDHEGADGGRQPRRSARALPARQSAAGLDTAAPHQGVHTPKLLVLLYEVNAMYRQIFIDGRPLPEDPTPGWNGYSTARWDGDTLVVQTAGFRDNLWIDMGGSPMSDAAKMTERIRRPNYGPWNWRSPSTIRRSTPGR